MSDTWTTLFKQMEATDKAVKIARLGDDEHAIMAMFYDSKLKAKRQAVTRLEIFHHFVKDRHPNVWSVRLGEMDVSIQKLSAVPYIAAIASTPALAKSAAGSFADAYKLTDEGLEYLQRLHPSIALKLRGIIAVAPPWLVLLGGIAGGVGAVWKITDLALSLL